MREESSDVISGTKANDSAAIDRPEDSTDSESSSSVGARILTACLVAALVVLTIQWWQLTKERPAPLPWTHGETFEELFHVNVNNATWVEWMQLEGIGETMAHRIVADRETNGPFRSIEDLQRVDGIGPTTLDRIRDSLTISHEPAERSEPQSTRTAVSQ